MKNFFKRTFLPGVLIMALTGCVNYSKDPIPELADNWVSGDYLIDQRGDSRTLLIKQAKVYLNSGDYEQAWNRLNRETFRYVSNPELSFLKGKTAFYLEDHQNAGRYLQDARELGYTGDELFYLIAANHLALGEPESAIDVVNTLLKLEQKPSFHTLKAEVLLQTGDTVQAEKEYRTSISADSSIRNNYRGLATIAAARNQGDRALDMLDRWLDKNPSDQEFLMMKASTLENTGQLREAGHIYASLSSESDPHLLALRARNYLRQGKADSAALMANQSIVYRDSIETRLILGRALERQRLYADAEKAYDEILAQDSTQSEAIEAAQRLRQRRRYLDYLREHEAATQDSSSGNSAAQNQADSTGQ